MAKKDKRIQDLVDAMIPQPSPTDPQGSWTGRPMDGEYEVPVQDADDL